MCRNIRKLRRADTIPSDSELHDAALQFIRKITGFRVPSRVNQPAFDRAVLEVAASAHEFFVNFRSVTKPGKSSWHLGKVGR